MKSPRGKCYMPYKEALSVPHLLIAGTTGSGKSVLLNGLIYTALYNFPMETKLVLIDPKRCELSMYRRLPHTIAYASEPNDIIRTIENVMMECDKRYKRMQRKNQKTSTEAHIYVIIDEYADLMATCRKQVEPLIQRLGQIGRASNIHIWLGTQNVTREIISTKVKCNFDARFALRTRSAQDSRNILGINGCETLPRHGECFWMNPNGIQKIKVPYYSDDELKERVKHWTKQKLFGIF